MRLLPKNPLTRSLVLGTLIGAIASAGIIGLLVLQSETQYPSLIVCPGLCGGPKEALNLGSSNLNSPTNITLSLINTGTAQVALIAYYVKDSTGDTYSQPSWSGPTLPPNPNSGMPVNILIDGKAFTFQSGNNYTVELVTSRYNQFTMVATT